MNKNGWGLRVELAFLLLFLICLLISIIGLHRLGLLGNDGGVYRDRNGYIEDGVNFNYNVLEEKVVNAAEKYYQDKYNGHTDDTLIISTSTLKQSGYLDRIEDNRARECKGYATVLKTNNIVSYIKCSFYKTAGYNSDYE